MSDDIRFERNARAWLELGPAHAPERVVKAALATVDTTPQQRSLRAPWRLPSVKLAPRFATAAIAVIVVIAAGFLLLRNDQSQIAAPATATPLPSPASSPRATPTPSASGSTSVTSPVELGRLRDAWESVGQRTSPDFAGPGIANFIIDDTGLRIPSVQYETRSSITAGQDGSLVLTLEIPRGYLTLRRWPCSIGDQGRYLARLSPDEQTLTLALLADQCTARGGVLEGNWTRQPCGDYFPYCMSEASPGAQSSMFKPFDGGNSGSFTYALPAGWTVNSAPPDWPGPESAAAMSLSLLDSYDGPAVDLYSNVAAQTDVVEGPPFTCRVISPPIQSAAAIADWLESLDVVNVASRTPVTVGGLSGIQLDVSVVRSNGDTCSPSDTLTLFSRAGKGGDVVLYGQRDERARYILLDRDGGILLIAVRASGEGAWESFILQATPIIDSFEFSSEGS